MCQGVVLGGLWRCSTCVQTYRTGCWGLFCVSPICRHPSHPPGFSVPCTVWVKIALQTVWNMQRRRGARRSFNASVYIWRHEASHHSFNQSFNPFMPTREHICSMNEQEQPPPPLGKSSQCYLSFIICFSIISVMSVWHHSKQRTSQFVVW